jgi:hypothetical protein
LEELRINIRNSTTAVQNALSDRIERKNLRDERVDEVAKMIRENKWQYNRMANELGKKLGRDVSASDMEREMIRYLDRVLKEDR